MLKIGLIGLGHISAKHMAAISSLSTDVVCTGGYDINSCKSRDFEQKYGLRIFDNIDDLIQHNDIITVLTPHNTHADVIKKIIAYDKFCICEKPICLKEEELLNLPLNKQQKIFPISQNRYNTAIIKAKELLDKNKLGNIQFIQANTFWYRTDDYYTESLWRGKIEQEGGILYNQGIHVIDIILFLLKASSQDCHILSVFKKNLESAIKETETYFKILLEVNGILVDILVTTRFATKNYLNSIVVSGDKNHLIISGNHLNILSHPEVQGNDFSDDIYGFSHIQNYKEIIQYVKTGNGSPVSFKDGVDRIKLIQKLYAMIDEFKN